MAESEAALWLGGILAATWSSAGLPKILGRGPAIRAVDRVGMTVYGMRWVGMAETAGGVGVGGGIWLFTPLAVLSSACLVALMIGAIRAHVVNHDRWYGPINAIVMGTLMIVLIVLLV
jgi:DoxX-like protein